MKDSKKRVLVTGIFGQDGSYAAELLLAKGYEVHGISRERHDKSYTKALESQCTVHYGDIADKKFVDSILEKFTFDEVYNYAAISDLATAKKDPELTQRINHDAVGFIFIKASEINPAVRLYQASSSQMFDTNISPQSENTPMVARNPYAEAKIKAYNNFVLGLRKKGIFVCSGFLFNHESPRREERFVTGKISRTLARLKLGLTDSPLELGNMDMQRDWSFAGDVVNAAYLMLQAETAQDYVLASGVLHTVREFVELTAQNLEMHISWQGEGIEECGVDETGKVLVKVNKDFYAPNEASPMMGDISKIRKNLGWEPSVTFKSLTAMMAKSNLEELQKGN